MKGRKGKNKFDQKKKERKKELKKERKKERTKAWSAATGCTQLNPDR